MNGALLEVGLGPSDLQGVGFSFFWVLICFLAFLRQVTFGVSLGYLFTALLVKPQVGTKIRRMEVLFRSSSFLMTATLEGEETPSRP